MSKNRGRAQKQPPAARPLLLRELYPPAATGGAAFSGAPASDAAPGGAAYHSGPVSGDGPANLLVEGDNLPLLEALCEGPLRDFALKAGGLKLLYLDPPFAVGADFYTDSALGPHKCLAYRDSWPGGLTGYLDMMRARLLLAHRALAADGCLFLHCDSRVSHHLRLMLDEIFGPERFLGEIIWHYTGGGRARRWFSRKHDSIFHYAVSANWHFDPDAARLPYKPGSGYARSGIVSAAGKRYLPHPDGSPVDDVWDIPMVNPLAAERSGYPTQKPLALLERILAVCSRPGDLTADFFCGSGTLALAAARLGRRWICADRSPLAVQTARLRLLAQQYADFALAVPVQEQEQEQNWREARLPYGKLRYRLEARLRLERRGRGLLAHLEDIAVHFDSALPRSAAGQSAPLPQKGLDWLRAWGLSLPLDPDCVPPCLAPDSLSRRALWRTLRCQKRGIALCSPELPLPKGRPLLDLEDIFGNSVCLDIS
ncbi:site-specific DNA-methyltransferase [Desulfovibrio sp. OttesenSCG-928-G11]|nr:site-specific DNA-methyltransferase [Desulfovibrio sp. OttesenSCG-928-G11]